MAVYLELPPQQARVVDLVLEGLSNREIAQRMGISPHTVCNHLKPVFLRYGVKSRAELIIKEMRRRNGASRRS